MSSSSAMDDAKADSVVETRKPADDVSGAKQDCVQVQRHSDQMEISAVDGEERSSERDASFVIDGEHAHTKTESCNANPDNATDGMEAKEDDDIHRRLTDYLSQRGNDPEATINDDTFNTDAGDSDEDDQSGGDVDRADDDDIDVQQRISSEQLEAQRQEILREIAVHDRIGGYYIPEVKPPVELLSGLIKRREKGIAKAKERRRPFEKFQDFDAFIDELTITDDQSWKTLTVVMDYQQTIVIPSDLAPFLKDLTREILRHQPQDLVTFCRNYCEGRLSTEAMALPIEQETRPSENA